MQYTIVIPARYASSRFPGKPLADIAGKPMVVRVAERVAKCGAPVIVATDHAGIASVVREHGFEAVMTRNDHATGTDRLAEVAGKKRFGPRHIVVNVQGDEPLIDPLLIAACAHKLTETPDCVMATVAHPILHVQDFSNPNVVKVVLDRQQRALYFSRSPIPAWRDGPAGALPQDPVSLRHVGLYAYRAGFLRKFPSLPPAPLERTEALEQLRVLWHGERIAVHLSAQAPGTGVDTPEDLARVRQILGAHGYPESSG